jgi:hypothetical protein
MNKGMKKELILNIAFERSRFPYNLIYPVTNLGL